MSAGVVTGHNSASQRAGAGRIRASAPRPAATPARRTTAARQAESGRRLHWTVVSFLVSLVVPWVIIVGPLRLSVYRLVLLATLLPCLVMWARVRAGRIRPADVALILFGLWASLSLIANHGGAGLQSAGILLIETLGPYYLARCYIRTADDFRQMAKTLFIIVACLLPFAVVEVTTSVNPILKILGSVLPTIEITVMPPRWRLWRVQGPFDHSILFGTVCASTVALVYLVAARGNGFFVRILMTGTVALTAFLSLSSAPIAVVFIQVLLLAWDSMLQAVKSRWKLLLALVLGGVAVIAIGSNQSLPAFYISHFTFDGQTGWFRMMIWDAGTDSVRHNTLLGVGLGEWERPSWMPFSIDNFWLILAVRHGLPAVGLFCFFFFAIFLPVALRKLSDERLVAYRTAYLIVLVGFAFVAWTVHFWNSTYVLFLFLAGSGVWLLDAKEPTPVGADEVQGPRGRHAPRDALRQTPRPLASCGPEQAVAAGRGRATR